jgi:hypothetical protein
MKLFGARARVTSTNLALEATSFINFLTPPRLNRWATDTSYIKGTRQTFAECRAYGGAHPRANCAIPDEASMLDAIRVERSEYPKDSEKFKGAAYYSFSSFPYTVNRLSLR